MAVGEYVLAKLIGAISGSSVALVFAQKNASSPQLFKQFMVGVVCGFICAPFFIDWVGVPHTFDYWVFAATVCSVCSYYVLQAIFGEGILQKIISKFIGAGK